jgi:GT2 family glycosyltransferase
MVRDMSPPHVTVVVVTWNAAADIEESLSSVMNQSYSNYDVMVVDSASTDNTLEIVRTRFPSVRVIASEENLGYRRGNRLGMLAADGDLIVSCNDDVKVEREWLAKMVEAMEQDESLGLVTPLILNYDTPELISAAGNNLHFAGLSGHSKYRNRSKDVFTLDEYVPSISGCCFMIRRELLRQLEGFSEDFERFDTGWHASLEEVDLSWRAQLLGYGVKCVSGAVMYHKHSPRAVPVQRFISYEWGRYLLVLRNYETRTLTLLLPFLFLIELASWGYVLLKGNDWLGAKIRLWKWLLANKKTVRDMRARVQRVRSVSDASILKFMSTGVELSPTTGYGRLARFARDVFNGSSGIYYRLLCWTVGFS